MKPKILFLIFIGLLYSCKKEKKTDSISYLNRTGFEDTLVTSPGGNQELFAAHSGTGASECFYIVQKTSGSSYFLVKTNLDAKVSFTSQIQISDTRLQDVCGSKISADFYTLNASEKSTFQPSGTLIQAYVQASQNIDSSSCDGENNPSNYFFDTELDVNISTTFDNNCQVKKFNHKGVEIWNFALEGSYFSGNAMETDFEGNLYVLTVVKHRPVPVLMPFSGTIFPYYSFNSDSNTVILYKFNKDGILLFKTQSNKAFKGLPENFNPRMALTKNAVYVCSFTNFFRFSLNGELESTTKPVKNVCYNTLATMIANPMFSELYVVGVLNYTGNSRNRYFVGVNRTSEFNLINASIVPYNFVLIDSQQNIYSAGGTYLTKTNQSGQRIYSKPILGNSFIYYVGENNCGVDHDLNFYFFATENGLIKMFKLDVNGNIK